MDSKSKCLSISCQRSKMMQQCNYAVAPSYTVDTDACGIVNSDTMPMLSASSFPSQNWEMMKSETFASLSDEGNNLASNLGMLQEAIKTRVWATYGVTSTWHRLALSKTAKKRMSILEVLAKAYHDWKLSCNSTSEPWKDRHSEKSISPVSKAKQGNHAPRNQEGITPAHSNSGFCDKRSHRNCKCPGSPFMK